jgi:hypothetical protein
MIAIDALTDEHRLDGSVTEYDAGSKETIHHSGNNLDCGS